jgi:hypothetical protein
MKHASMTGRYSMAVERVLSAFADRRRRGPGVSRPAGEQWHDDFSARMFEAAKRHALR